MKPAHLLLALLLVGCPESTTIEPDASIVFDPIPDAGTDAGPALSVGVGSECATDADCGEGYCITADQGFSAGYCTAACPTLEECPTGSSCVDVGGGQLICLDDCDPAAETRECRQFYGCAGGLGVPAPVCLPGCTDDTDCDAGSTCNPENGGRCYDPDAEWYDACQSSDQCPDGGRCRDEDRGQPGGMCQAFGCDVDNNSGCPGDGQCIPGGRSGFGRCIDGCETATDCRAGYDCTAPTDYPDRLHCTAACNESSDCPDTGLCDADTGRCGE